MARYAQLNSGEVLEFPDNTTDEVMDKVVLREHEARDPKSDFGASRENTVGRAIGENVRGAITAAGDFVGSVPGMIAAAPYGVADAVTQGPSKGLETFGAVAGAMNPLSEDFHYGKLPGVEALTPDRQTGAYHNLNKPFEMIPQGIGNITGGIGQALGQDPQQWGDAGALATNVGMAGAAAKGGVNAYRGFKEGQAQKAAAADLLQRRQAGDAEYQSWNDIAAESEKNAAALRELDATMSVYGKDLQAPQLGLGGKVARHEDQAGKRVQGEFRSQMAMDEEMRAQGEEQSKQQPLQVPSVLDAYEPTYEGSTLDHAPSPVRPHQIVQERKGIISEGEATQIYLKPKFLRTLEDKMKLEEYERSLKGPRIDEVASDGNDIVAAAQSSVQIRNVGLYDLQRSVPDAMRPGSNVTFRQQLEHIAATSEAEPNRAIAKLLLEDPTFDPKFTLTSDTMIGDAVHRPRQAPALYDGNKHEIRMRPDMAGNESVTLHEAIHARTQSAIELVRRQSPTAQHLIGPVNRLADLYNAFKKGWNPDELPPYGLKTIHEFIAEAFSNADFQAELARTKLPFNLRRNGLLNYWDKFMEAIGRLFGFDKNTQNYLSETLRVGADIMAGADQEVRSAYTGHKDGAYSFGEFKKDLESQGIKVSSSVAKSLYDKQQQKAPQAPAHPKEGAVRTIKDIPGLSDIQKQYADSRTFEEVLPEAVKAKDISFLNKHVIDKIIQGKFTALDHPLLSWTSSQIHWIKNTALERANAKLHGKDRQAPDPGTYNYGWRQLKASEREQVNRVGQAFNNEAGAVSVRAIQAKARELFGQELSQKQLKSYQDRVRINKEVLADINKTLEANGKETIHELPNYWSPNVFKGPFLLKIIDEKTGDTTKIVDSYLKPNLSKLSFPGYRLEVVEKGLKKDMDFDQLEWVLRHLSKEMRDPAARAIAEGLRRQGFRRHGLKRDMVEGGQGTGEGRKALREYEETSERYIRGAYDYISNRELDSVFTKILDEKQLDGSPNAKAFSLESIDTARGGANAFFESASSFIGELFRGTIKVGTLGKVNLPQKAFRDILRQSNKTYTTPSARLRESDQHRCSGYAGVGLCPAKAYG
jgi:hypothetical protein